MNLKDIIEDIHVLTDDVKVYERKYGILSKTFYTNYSKGIEPENDDWVLDWSDWAGAYKILIRRQQQYDEAIQALEAQNTDYLRKAARHDPIPIAS